MPFQFKCFHDFESRVGIIGGVGQLARAEVRAGPVAGGGRFRFLEALFQEHAHGTPNANLSAISHLAEGLIKVEDVIEVDSQSVADLAAIVLQSESHF